MWYALGHIEQPAPVIRKAAPVIRQVAPVVQKPQPAALVAPRVMANPAPDIQVQTHTVYTTQCRPVPGYLQKMVVIPAEYQVSEITALHFLARKIGLRFTHAGPNYALYDTRVHFGKSVTALQFIQSVLNSYVPGVLFIRHGTLTVENLPPSYIKTEGAIQYQ